MFGVLGGGRLRRTSTPGDNAGAQGIRIAGSGGGVCPPMLVPGFGGVAVKTHHTSWASQSDRPMHFAQSSASKFAVRFPGNLSGGTSPRPISKDPVLSSARSHTARSFSSLSHLFSSSATPPSVTDIDGRLDAHNTLVPHGERLVVLRRDLQGVAGLHRQRRALEGALPNQGRRSLGE